MRVALVVVALTAAAAASQSAAQTTRCVNVGNGVTNCSTAPGIPPPPVLPQYQPSGGPSVAGALLGAYLAGRPDRQARAASKKAEKVEAIKRSVAYYASEGKCDRAVQVALDAGELDMAADAKSVCVPR